jgi:hypothetical protein
MIALLTVKSFFHSLWFNLSIGSLIRGKSRGNILISLCEAADRATLLEMIYTEPPP